MRPDTSGDPVIRRATPDDLDGIGRLFTMLVEAHCSFDSLRFLAASDWTSAGYASWLRSQLDNADVVVLVADHQGDVVGYSYAAVEGHNYMDLRGPAGYLHDIVVDPEHRGRGIGRLLLDATLAYLKERGVPRVLLMTAEQNAAAQRLFTDAGFRRTMIEMTRELEP